MSAPVILSAAATKGGVGKTTLIANVSAVLADIGLRVLMIDCDVQPSLSKYYPINHRAPNGIVELLLGENTEEIIKCDLAKEEEKHAALAAAIAVCEAQQDYVSRALLEKQKDINEEHIDWLETQQELIAKMGLENYIQLGAQED